MYKGMLLCALVIFVSSATCSAAIWIVDENGGPGVDFTAIQPAVDAAAPGDTIRVHVGLYTGFSLVKPLKIVAATGTHPGISGSITISSLGVNESAVLRGFQFYNIFASSFLTLSACEGAVHVDDCWITDECNLVLVDSCHQVNLSRCLLNGTSGGAGVPAVSIRDSTVVFSQCSLSGSEGDENLMADGGPALWALQSQVYFYASTAVGGKGADLFLELETAGDGAPGMELQQSVVQLFGMDNHLIEGGSRGENQSIFGWDGVGASAIEAYDSTLTYSGVTLVPKDNQPAILEVNTNVEWVDPAVPVLTLAGTGKRGEDLTMTLNGTPDSEYAILLSLKTAITPIAGFHADLFLDPVAFRIQFVDLLPLMGFKDHTMTVPHNPNLEGKSVYWQAYLLPPVGAAELSVSAAIVIQ